MQKGTKRHLSLGESVARLVSLGARNGLKARNVRPFLLIHFYIRMDIKDIIKKVKQIEIRTRKKTEQTLMGQYHSAFKGQGMTFSEVRPYQFGDEIRRIDWNKTARFREPFVKVME